MDEYVKLVKLAMVHILGLVEDERCFSSLTFLKDKVQNKLNSDHLSLVVGIKAQQVNIWRISLMTHVSNSGSI